MVDLSSIVFQDALNIARMTDELMKLGNQFSPVIGLEGIAAQIAADTARMTDGLMKLDTLIPPVMGFEGIAAQIAADTARMTDGLMKLDTLIPPVMGFEGIAAQIAADTARMTDGLMKLDTLIPPVMGFEGIAAQIAADTGRLTDRLVQLGSHILPVMGLDGVASLIAADTARVMEDFVKLGSHMQPLLAVDPLASLSSQFSLEAAKTSELLSRSFNLAAQVGPLLQIRKPTRRKFKRPERARRSAKPSRPSIRRPNSALEISSDARNDFAALALQLVAEAHEIRESIERGTKDSTLAAQQQKTLALAELIISAILSMLTICVSLYLRDRKPNFDKSPVEYRQKVYQNLPVQKRTKLHKTTGRRKPLSANTAASKKRASVNCVSKLAKRKRKNSRRLLRSKTRRIT